MVKSITSQDFSEEVLNQKGIVLVDFFATWCPPCKMLAPVLEKVSESRQSFKIVKVNIDQNPDKASEYDVEVVPTLLVFKDGKMVKKSEGYIPEDEVVALLDEN